jgi:hypothetical protein
MYLALNCRIINEDRWKNLFGTESNLRDLNDNFQSWGIKMKAPSNLRAKVDFTLK